MEATTWFRRTLVAGFALALVLWLLGGHGAAQAPEGAGLPEVNGWRLAAALLQPRSEHAVADLEGKMYVIGGYPPGRIPSDVVQIYDIAADRWSIGPPVPVPLHHAMAAGVGGRLYVIGGEFDGVGTGRPEVYLDTVYELDPRAGAWRKRAAMPTARSAGGVAVIEGKIYAAGGRPPRGADFAVYDPAADRWTALPDLPTGRNHLAVGAIGGKVYVAGGRFGGGFNSVKTAALEIFDPTTIRWRPGRLMPTRRGGVAGVVANGCLYVIGGEGNTTDSRGLFDQNEAYDPQTNSWRRLAPMPTPTHGLGGCRFRERPHPSPRGRRNAGWGLGLRHPLDFPSSRDLPVTRLVSAIGRGGISLDGGITLHPFRGHECAPGAQEQGRPAGKLS